MITSMGGCYRASAFFLPTKYGFFDTRIMEICYRRGLKKYFFSVSFQIDIIRYSHKEQKGPENRQKIKKQTGREREYDKG